MGKIGSDFKASRKVRVRCERGEIFAFPAGLDGYSPCLCFVQRLVCDVHNLLEYFRDVMFSNVRFRMNRRGIRIGRHTVAAVLRNDVSSHGGMLRNGVHHSLWIVHATTTHHKNNNHTRAPLFSPCLHQDTRSVSHNSAPLSIQVAGQCVTPTLWAPTPLIECFDWEYFFDGQLR